MANIKFIPKFSIEIAANVGLFKIIDNKLYVQTRGKIGSSDPAVIDIMESNQIIKSLLEQGQTEETQHKVMNFLLTIPGVIEEDIWTVYDIIDVKGNVKLEEIPIVDTITLARPFHGNNIANNLVISELGFGYLGFKDTVIKNEEGHTKIRDSVEQKKINKKISQLGFLVEEKNEIDGEYKKERFYDTISREINLIYYDLQEKTLKYFPNVVTLTYEVDCKYSDSDILRESLNVYSGSKYFIIHDKQRKFKGNSKNDLYLIEVHTGHCRKITFPDSIEDDIEGAYQITKEKLLETPEAVKIVKDLAITQCKIDKIESYLSKVQNDDFKQKVNDNELYDIICESIFAQKSMLNIIEMDESAKLGHIIKPRTKRKSVLSKITLDDVILDNTDHLYLIYAAKSPSYKPKELTTLGVNLGSLLGSVDCNEGDISITKEMCQSVKFIVKPDRSRILDRNDWAVINGEYYLFTSELSVFDCTGKLTKYSSTGNETNELSLSTIIVLDDNGNEVLTCRPKEMYSNDDNIYYHTSGINIEEDAPSDDDENIEEVSKIFCYHQCIE